VALMQSRIQSRVRFQVVGNNESTTTNNAGESLVILIAMQMWRYDVGRIARWSTSRATLKAATGCHHRAECLRCIALAANMVGKFVENTQITNKHNF